MTYERDHRQEDGDDGRGEQDRAVEAQRGLSFLVAELDGQHGHQVARFRSRFLLAISDSMAIRRNCAEAKIGW